MLHFNGNLNQNELLVSCTEPKVDLSVELYNIIYALEKCNIQLIIETFWRTASYYKL